jgi:hypothetical protein
MQIRTHIYYGIYDGVHFMQLRHSEQWGWEVGIDYNNDGHVKSHHWNRLEGKLLEQVEPAIKEHGFLLPRSIINQQEYEYALVRADKLMDAIPNSRDSKELELLAVEIERWENEHYHIDEPSQGELI